MLDFAVCAIRVILCTCDIVKMNRVILQNRDGLCKQIALDQESLTGTCSAVCWSDSLCFIISL